MARSRSVECRHHLSPVGRARTVSRLGRPWVAVRGIPEYVLSAGHSARHCSTDLSPQIVGRALLRASMMPGGSRKPQLFLMFRRGFPERGDRPMSGGCRLASARPFEHQPRETSAMIQTDHIQRPPHAAHALVAALLVTTALAGGGITDRRVFRQCAAETAPIAVTPAANQPGFGDLVAKVKTAVVNIAVDRCDSENRCPPDAGNELSRRAPPSPRCFAISASSGLRRSTRWVPASSSTRPVISSPTIMSSIKRDQGDGDPDRRHDLYRHRERAATPRPILRC